MGVTVWNFITRRKSQAQRDTSQRLGKVLFEIMERLNDNETTVVIEHKNKLYTCKNREYLINGGRKITDLIRL